MLFADAFALVIGGLKHFRLSIGGPWGDMDLRVDRSATRAYRLRHADTVAADRDAAGFARNDGRGPDVALRPSDYQTAAPIPPQIACGDANTGYATSRGTLARTTDGGVHWSYLRASYRAPRPMWRSLES